MNKERFLANIALPILIALYKILILVTLGTLILYLLNYITNIIVIISLLVTFITIGARVTIENWLKKREVKLR